jgi:hypothetical protein
LEIKFAAHACERRQLGSTAKIDFLAHYSVVIQPVPLEIL